MLDEENGKLSELREKGATDMVWVVVIERRAEIHYSLDGERQIEEGCDLEWEIRQEPINRQKSMGS